MSEMEPLGHISEYGLEKLKTRNHYCVSVSHQPEKEYTIPLVTLSSAQAEITKRDERIERLTAALSEARAEAPRMFQVGDMVRKRSGSWWEGRVVGFYSTEQTPDGVCVQLDKPMGPVQIYPASALQLKERAP